MNKVKIKDTITEKNVMAVCSVLVNAQPGLSVIYMINADLYIQELMPINVWAVDCAKKYV